LQDTSIKVQVTVPMTVDAFANCAMHDCDTTVCAHFQLLFVTICPYYSISAITCQPF